MMDGAPVVVPTAGEAGDVLANVTAYLQEHLPDEQSARVGAFMEDLECCIEANRETDIECTDLLSGLPKEALPAAEALVADVGVLLTQRRNRLLRRAHDAASGKGLQSSDDGSLVLALNENVVLVRGERTNIKVTYPEDMMMAEVILKEQVKQ